MPHHHHHHHDEQLEELSERRLWFAVGLNLLLTVVEVVGGLLSGSLALLADALHNFGDCGSLIVALVARRWSKRQADRMRTFGYGRAEVVGAVINLTALIMVGFFLLSEAVQRAFLPYEVDGILVMAVSAVALVVDLGTAALLMTMSRSSVNIRAAMLHNLTDALSSVGVILVGVAVWLWGFQLADLLITVLIAGFVLWQSIYLLRRAIGVLMNSAPAEIDLQSVAKKIQVIDSVQGLHHVHFWQLDETNASLDAHVVIERNHAEQIERIKGQIKQVLHDEFEITHSTLEFEFAGESNCRDAGSSDLIAQH